MSDHDGVERVITMAWRAQTGKHHVKEVAILVEGVTGWAVTEAQLRMFMSRRGIKAGVDKRVKVKQAVFPKQPRLRQSREVSFEALGEEGVDKLRRR